MSKRKRKRRRGRLLIALAAVVLAGAVTWRWWRQSEQTAVVEQHSLPALSPVTPTALAPARAEDFSAAERQTLEEILRHKTTGEQP